MHKVAVIDSMVCNSLVLKDCRRVLNYSVKNRRVYRMKENSTDVFETHGTEVINNILYECKDVQIWAIKVLEENGKGKVCDLLEALKFCISQKVDVINISLGTQTQNRQLILSLEQVCRDAISQGIIIVAANNNHQGYDSYPAAFDFVVSVSTNRKAREYTLFNGEKNEIYFCSPYIFSKGTKKYEIKRGNSYLCGYVTGVLCTEEKITKDTIQFFWDKKNIQRFYINPFIDDAFGGNLVLVSFEENSFDIFIERNVKHSSQKVKWAQIKEGINIETEIIILGSIKLPIAETLRGELFEWISRLCDNCHPQIYTVVPIFNMKERYNISKNYGINIKTIYI